MSHVTSRNDFYKDLRPMLIFYKIIGLTSLKNVFSGPVKFQFGLNFLWPLLTYIAHCYMMWFCNFGYQKFMKRFRFVNYLLREFVNQLALMYIDMRLPKIIENINRFDEEFGQPTKHKIWFRYLVIINTGSLLSLFIQTYICSLHYITSVAGFEFILRYLSFDIPILYLLLCDEICMRFKSLRMRWRNEVSKVLLSKSRTTCQALELERLAHTQLCDLVEELRVTFGPQLTTYLFFIFLEHLARFYHIIYIIPHQSKYVEMENKWIFWMNMILFLARTWIGIFMVADFSDSLTESSKEIITDLRDIPIWNLPYDYCEQINIFMSQIQNSRNIITASGLFTINKTILSSIFISLVTYMIVIVQFFPDLERIIDE